MRSLSLLFGFFIGLPLSTWAAPLTAKSDATSTNQCTLQNDARGRRLQFTKGVFRTTVFTDLHYGEAQNPWEAWGLEQDVNSSRVMKTVLDIEKPDFVIFNGDQVTGENLLARNATAALDRCFSSVLNARLPFASIYGNHDNAVNISHYRLFAHEKSNYARWSMTQANPNSANDQNGIFNYVLPVYADSSATVPSLLLWFFDSRSAIFDDPSEYEDWVDPKVASWIDSTADCIISTFKLRYLPPSLSFVHIPLNKALELQKTLVDSNPKYPGINLDSPLDPQGQHHPRVQRPDQPFWNSLYTTLNGRHQNGLIATVFGHDHGNDWCAKSASRPWPLCFARHTGYGGYGSWNRGSRVFEISMSKNADTGRQAMRADSWIRLETGEKGNATVLWHQS